MEDLISNKIINQATKKSKDDLKHLTRREEKNKTSTTVRCTDLLLAPAPSRSLVTPQTTPHLYSEWITRYSWGGFCFVTGRVTLLLVVGVSFDVTQREVQAVFRDNPCNGFTDQLAGMVLYYIYITSKFVFLFSIGSSKEKKEKKFFYISKALFCSIKFYSKRTNV